LTRRIVVDASVAVKWLDLFAHEPLVSQAFKLLELRTQRNIEMLVPDLFWPEVGNILWKAVRKNECKPEDAHTGLALLEDQALQTVASLPLVHPALKIAIDYGRSLYDSVYVALAHTSSTELITADEKLANALAAHLPVKWLGRI